MEHILLGLSCPKLSVTITVEEVILPNNVDHQGTTGTKTLLEELFQWRYLLQMLWCINVMQLVAMTRVFKLMKNLLIMHLWHMPSQAHQALQDQIMRQVFDCEELHSHASDNSVPISLENDRYKTGEGYHAVLPPYTGVFLPPKPDLVFNDVSNASESVTNVLNVESSLNKPSKDMYKTLRLDAPIIKDWISDSEDETEIESVPKQKEPSFVPTSEHVKTPRETVRIVEHPKQAENLRTNNQQSRGHKKNRNKKAYFVCRSLNYLIKIVIIMRNKWNVVPTPVLTRSRLVSLNVARHVPTAGNPQQALKDNGVIDSGCSRHITGNISFLSDFKKINRGYVAFGRNPKGDTECVVLSSDYKLPDENYVLLRVPRENNMYNVDLKNLVPSGDLTYLFAKATLDESSLWHRRLGHINFKTMNKLVKGNLVRGNQPNDNAGIKENLDVGKVGKEIVSAQQYVLLPLWSTGSQDPQNTNDAVVDASFDVKENENDVYISPSRSEKIDNKKHDEKSKSDDKGKSHVDSPIGVKDLRAKFKEFLLTALTSLSDTVVSPNFGIARKSLFMDPSKYLDDPNMPKLEDIVYSDDEEDFGVEADLSNLETNISVSPILTTRVHKDHPVTQTIGDLTSAPQTRKEPKKVHQALKDPSWIKAMQEELLQFKMQKVWVLVDLPKGKRAIGLKWVFRNTKDKKGIMIRNKARPVAQGHTQEEGMDYDEVFAPVARIEAIRLFLDYAFFMGFMVYQMDVKSAFLYGTIKEEVYVCQHPGFKDPDYPDKVYKVVKALYGLHQAPRAWCETLDNFLLENGFQKGKIDETLFIKKQK
nr:putative ribonuclease H-like domain-containing protein [Tanacetum cinerariifolium]